MFWRNLLIIASMILLCGVVFAATRSTGEQQGQIRSSRQEAIIVSKRTEFFTGNNKLDADWNRVKSIHGTRPAGPEDKRLVQNIHIDLTYILRPIFVPTVQFVTKHVRLRKATPQDHVDTAFLTFQVGKADIMVVLHGGPLGKAYVFVDDPSVPQRGYKESAQIGAQMVAAYVMDRYLPLANTIVGTFAVQSTGAKRSVVLKATPMDMVQSAVVHGHEVGVSFPLSAFSQGGASFAGVGQPAREPQADQWFEWYRRK